MKRVLLLSYSFNFGGSEILCLKAAKALKNKGADVRVMATHTGPGELCAEYDKLGIKTYCLNNDQEGTLKSNARMLMFLLRWRPYSVYAQHITTVGVVLPALMILGIKRLVATEHTDFEFKKYESFRVVAKRTLPRIKALTVIHKGLLEYFSDNFPTPKTGVHLIHNGIDLNKFSPKTQEQDPEVCNIGWVGRIHEQKNVRGAIDAMRELKARSEQRFHLTVIGDGDLLDTEKAYAKELGLEQDITFLGKRSDIDQLMTGFDLYVMSSKTEGVPFTLIEAQASGIPAIVPAVGGIPFFVEPGKTGFLYEAGDTQALAQHIIKLAGDQALRQTISINSRAFAEQNYNDDDILNQYCELLLN